MPPIFYYLTPNTHFSIITLNKPQQKQMKDKHTADRAYNKLYDCECKYKKIKLHLAPKCNFTAMRLINSYRSQFYFLSAPNSRGAIVASSFIGLSNALTLAALNSPLWVMLSSSNSNNPYKLSSAITIR